MEKTYKLLIVSSLVAICQGMYIRIILLLKHRKYFVLNLLRHSKSCNCLHRLIFRTLYSLSVSFEEVIYEHAIIVRSRYENIF